MDTRKTVPNKFVSLPSHSPPASIKLCCFVCVHFLSLPDKNLWPNRYCIGPLPGRCLVRSPGGACLPLLSFPSFPCPPFWGVTFVAWKVCFLSSPLLSSPLLSSPLLSSPLLSSPLLSSPLLSSPFLSFPFLSFPFLSFPFLSFPFLSFPFLSVSPFGA